MLQLKYPDSSKQISKSRFCWTGNTTDLLELIYALHANNCFNNGDVSIGELAIGLGELLHVDLSNCYGLYGNIRRRKINRTLFLDELREMLKKKMEDSDTKEEERTSRRNR